VGRRGATRRLGGDAFQVEETAAVLRAAGHQAIVEASADLVPEPGDVIHLHNIQRVLDWGDLPERAAAASATIVITPLYHPTAEYHRRGRRGVEAGIARLIPNPDVFAGLRWGRATGLKARALEVLRSADRVLTAHESERELLESDIGGFSTPTIVVPVAIPSVEDVTPDDDVFGPRVPFIACIGRIEPLKNPMSVLEAARRAGCPVAFVGPTAGPRHAGYVARFRAGVRAAGPERARFLGELPRAAVLRLLRGARGHALASWTEVVGRVTLEAAAAGAAVVMTDVGFGPSYLEDTGAHVVPPGDVDALVEAFGRALDAPRPGRDGALARRVRARFTWNVVAPTAVAAIIGDS
jgi:glycosyltransferase involved in cell wall biosynthesis